MLSSSVLPVDAIALRYLVEVVDAGSFAKAAARLTLNPSTLIRRVAKVEDRLGLTLLERTRVGVRVTPCGRPVVEQMRHALSELAAVEATARSTGTGSRGEIRLGMRLPLVGEPLGRLLVDWRRRFPDVQLKIFEMSSLRAATALGQRHLDAALLTTFTSWPGTVTIPLYQEALSAALPACHPLAAKEALQWADLRGQTILLQEWDESQTTREHYASLIGSCALFREHKASKQTILSLVAAQFGITLVTASQAETATPGVIYRRIAEENAQVQVELVWHPELEDAVVGSFIAYLRDEARSWLAF